MPSLVTLTQIYFSLIIKPANDMLYKSHSNLFLEPTSTKQWGYVMGAFDGDQTHTWQASTNYTYIIIIISILKYHIWPRMYSHLRLHCLKSSS